MIPDPLMALAIAQGVAGIAQTGIGLAKSFNQKRPTMEVPMAMQQGLNQAQILASQNRMPQQSTMENQIQSNAATAIRQARELSNSPASILGAVAGIQRNTDVADQNMGMKAAEMQRQAQQHLINQQNVVGQYQQKAFDYNEAQKYAEQNQANQAMMGAGLQNMWGAGYGYVANEQQGEYLKALKESMKKTSNYVPNLDALNANLTHSFGVSRVDPTPMYNGINANLDNGTAPMYNWNPNSNPLPRYNSGYSSRTTYRYGQ